MTADALRVSTDSPSRLVFLGWAGAMGKAVALALREWIPNVIQVAAPWMSETDIEAGARWSPEIANQLSTTNVGIICLTPDSKESAWIHFEAGALAKSVGDKTRVCPYLFHLKKSDVVGPLSQFQLEIADEQGTFRVLKAVNGAIGIPLDTNKLETSFQKWWPELWDRFSAIPTQVQIQPDTRKDRDIMEEILDKVRQLASRASTPVLTFPQAQHPAGQVVLTEPLFMRRERVDSAGGVRDEKDKDETAVT